MPRVYSMRKGAEPAPPEAVYIGRSSAYGNPFIIGRDGNRAAVIAKFRAWINEPEQAQLRAKVRADLRGRELLCWCAPLPCHGDVLLEIANA